MKILFALLTCLIPAFGQNPISPNNWQTLVASRDVKGMILDGCSAYTGLNSASTACADNTAALNAVINCNVNLVLDVGTGISSPIVGPKNCSFAITGPGTLNAGVFALPAFSTNGGGALISNNWSPYPTTGTPATQLGSVTVSGLTINGNARNQNAIGANGHLACALDGNLPCIGIWLYALQSATIEHNTILPMGGWTAGSFDGSFETLFSNIGTIQVNHNTVTGLSTPTSDTLHFSGPIGSINADGNDLYNSGDDAICLCGPEESGGSIGPATFVNTRATGTSQFFRMFNNLGTPYPMGPVTVSNFVVTLTNSEGGPVFDLYGNSTGTSALDQESITFSHGRVSGADNGLTNIQGSWAGLTCNDVILSGANSSGAPLIKITGSTTNLSATDCGWEMTQAKHTAGTYLQDVGTIARLHIADPLCLQELGATGEPFNCSYLIDTTAGGGGTIGIAEIVDTTNAGGYFPNLYVSGTLAHVSIVAGDLTGFPMTVASLPAAPTTGTRAIVTDGSSPTLYATISGGGSTVTPVLWNGTHWIAY